MRILYGVSGDGFGHSSRAKVIAKYLESQGHQVVIRTYGQSYDVLKKDFRVTKIYGLHLSFEKGVLKKRKTLSNNLRNLFKTKMEFKKFLIFMKEFKPELCISDMEPFVPIIAYWCKLPLVSIDNQHILTHLKINILKKYKKDYLIAREIINFFVRKADYFIITSFLKAPIKRDRKNTFIVPPIVHEGVVKLKPKDGDKILIYLTKKDKSVLDILKNIDEKFVVYGYGVNKKLGNLEFKTKDSFLNELKNCKAVIATAGFTLMSEAIYLRKPYFALPLKGQFEQTFNALFLKKAGFGGYSEDLTEKEVTDFLGNLDKYKKKLKNCGFSDDILFRVLDKVIKKYK